MKQILSRENGSTLIEALAAVTLVSFISLAVIQSSLIGIKTNGRNQLLAFATELGQDTLEHYSSVNPELFIEGTTAVETLVFRGKPFHRTVTVSINSDRSREVVVQIESTKETLNIKFEGSNSYPLWGQR